MMVGGGFEGSICGHWSDDCICMHFKVILFVAAPQEFTVKTSNYAYVVTLILVSVMSKWSKHPLKHLRQGQSKNSPKINVATFPFSEEYTIYSCFGQWHTEQTTNVNVELDYHYIATCVM